jgi:hypothetical protein
MGYIDDDEGDGELDVDTSAYDEEVRPRLTNTINNEVGKRPGTQVSAPSLPSQHSALTLTWQE